MTTDGPLPSPLIEFAPSRPLPGAIQQPRPLHNEAVLCPGEPFTILLPPRQWAFGALFPLDHAALAKTGHEGPIIIRFDLKVVSGLVGIAAVQPDSGLFTTAEEIVNTGNRSVTVMVEQPAESIGIVFRSAAKDGAVTRVEVIAVEAAARTSEQRLKARPHDLGIDLFVILSLAKTGTQTVEQTLLALAPAAQVRRLHCASAEAVAMMRDRVTRSRIAPHLEGSLAKSILHQCDLGEELRAEIAAVRRLGGRILFITGVREPIGRAVSSMFQTLPLQISAFRELHAIGPGCVDLLAEGLIDWWRREVAAGAATLETGLWTGCLLGTDFFNREFRDVTGFDLLSEPFDAGRGFGIVTRGRDTVLVYRSSDASTVLPQVLGELAGRDDITLVDTNIGEGKDYADVYRSFLTRFRVPADLVNSIYSANTYLEHFYSDAELIALKQRWTK